MFTLLNPKPVRKLLDEHQSRRQDNHKLLFSLVMLEQWLREMPVATESAGAECLPPALKPMGWKG